MNGNSKRAKAYAAQEHANKFPKIAKNEIKNEEEFLKNSFHIELRDAYKRQEWMILGEASVFVLSLLIGIVFINRGYHKEILAAKQSSNFLLSITHELKSPIASIRLGFETLQRKKLSEEQSLVLLKNGINDTDRLNNLVSDLLLSARLESTYQLNTELFSLEILIEECIQLLKQKFPSAIIKVNLIQEIPEILADYSAIRSVIINLLENAVKYSDSVPEINIGLTSTNERCNIEVSDKGIGIDQSERKKVFEKFYRVGNEDQRKTKGTGLGLYIVDQIVRAHNGTITVSSNQPKGTIFNIFLPFN